jgi:DNA polymerase-3 subunit delta'
MSETSVTTPTVTTLPPTTPTGSPAAPPRPGAVLDRIVGQPRPRNLLAASLAAPVHAYLFLGPPGSGKREAALAFGAALVCPNGGCGVCGACRGALAGIHPDVNVVERTGASITVDEARAITVFAQRTPTAAPRQALILVDFHLVDRAGPALLKTIEEPPPSTVFIVLAESVPPPLVTIASRCVVVDFAPLDEATITSALTGEGLDPDVAAAGAAGSSGRLDRARLLAADPAFSARQARWRTVPERLDGTGATVALLTAELLSGGDELVAVVKARQVEELAALTAASKAAGERALGGRAAIEARHNREQRRVRTDELRAGLATLAGAYRARLVEHTLPARRLGALASACDAVDESALALERNPTESLLIERLLCVLDGLGQ